MEGDDFSRHLQELFEAVAHRAYELFEEGGRREGHDLDHWFHAESQFLQPVPVEFGETEAEYIPGTAGQISARGKRYPSDPCRLVSSAERSPIRERPCQRAGDG